LNNKVEIDEEKSLKDEIEKDIKGTTKAKKVLKSIFRFLKIFLISSVTALGGLFVLGFLLGYALYVSYANSFNSAKVKNNSTQVVFYDAKNEKIFESFGATSPDKAKLSEVPETIISATLAAEDADFYKHGPIDLKGLARAAYINFTESEKSGLGKLTDLFSEDNYSQGGSSITQQLVKNLYLTNEKSFEKKFREKTKGDDLCNSTREEILKRPNSRRLPKQRLLRRTGPGYQERRKDILR
jgi:penicillin-binding protein 1A